MYACITEKNGFFDLDGNVSSDDEDDFFEKKIPKNDPTGTSDAVKRKYARHRRYHANPEVERERNIVKKKYNRMRRAIVKMGGVVDKELTREIFDAIDCKVFKHPDTVYLEEAVGDRRMYNNVKLALAKCIEHNIVLAVGGIYVLCESADDCKAMIDKMKALSINGRQLLPMKAMTKMMFILQSANKADISTMKDVLSDHLKVRRRDIDTSPMPGGDSFVVISSIVGTFAENNNRLNELKNDPPAGCTGIMSLFKNLTIHYSGEADTNYLLAEMSPQMPYNYQNGKPIILVIDNKGALNLNVNNVGGDGSIAYTNGNTSCGNAAHEEKVAGHAVAVTWIQEHSPANEFTKNYYDAYAQHAGDDAVSSIHFNTLVKAAGFKKVKKSNQGGRHIWRPNKPE